MKEQIRDRLSDTVRDATKTMEATAKAAEATAKAADNAITGTRELGGFLAKICGEGFVELGGAFRDWASVYRYQNALKLRDKVDEIHQRRRLEGKTIPLPPRIAIPLLDKATQENDETLQEMWAALIANGTDPMCERKPSASFISILSSLDPLESLILRALVLHEADLIGEDPISVDDIRILIEPPREAEELRMSLENLLRLGCVWCLSPQSIDDLDEARLGVHPRHDSKFSLTYLGRDLVEACTA